MRSVLISFTGNTCRVWSPPTPGSYDAFGCFTGSVLPGAEVPTILYTGVTKSSTGTIRGEGLREVQCLATSPDPDLRTWKKLDKPVLEGPPPGLQVTGFRDPCPWKDGDSWYMVVGSGFNKVGGAVLLYTSPGRSQLGLPSPASARQVERKHQDQPRGYGGDVGVSRLLSSRGEARAALLHRGQGLLGSGQVR